MSLSAKRKGRDFTGAVLETVSPTPTRIVAAATMLFWLDGYHAVSTDMICKKAGVSKGSLYHAFASKAHILASCLDAIWHRNWEEIRGIYDSTRAVSDKFRDHLLWFAVSQERLAEQYGLILGSFDMAIGVSIPLDVRRSMQSHQQMHMDLLRQSISSILGLEQHSNAVSWCVDMVGDSIVSSNFKARMDNSIAPLEMIVEKVDRLFDLTRLYEDR